jgi:hypothetical protein
VLVPRQRAEDKGKAKGKVQKAKGKKVRQADLAGLALTEAAKATLAHGAAPSSSMSSQLVDLL